MKKSCVLRSLIDYILVIFLTILSLSKGGFYKSDIIIFSIGVSSIAFFYTAINIYLCISKEKYKFDFVEILLLLLSVSYIFPIFFNNYADLNSSIFEFVRYLNLYSIYSIVKRSKNKRIYIYAIICITLLQCILSIDMIGNRYLENILSSISSGYLDIDLNRMSGTLQYANVLAILCLISSVLIFDLLNKKENRLIELIYYNFLFVLITTIILTGTRTVILLTLIAFIILFVNNKDNVKRNILIYIAIVVLAGIYTSLIYSQISSIKVYYTFFIFLALTTLILTLIFKLYDLYQNKWKNKFIIKKSYIMIFLSLGILIYVIITFNTSKPLLISEISNKESNNVILNDIKFGENLIEFKVDMLENDTRYKINLNSVDNNNIENNIKVFNYTENTSGDFKYKFDLANDIKYIKIHIECQKGSISVDKLYLNNVKQKLDYIFIPRNLIYRFKDLIHGSTSTADRLTYYNDAIKIITKSIPNFVVGTGGEGFNNIYEQVKEKDYYSTEVHSSFLQIFVEAGVLGFLVIVSILLYTVVKSKNNYIKLAYLLLVIHSFIDLNFSYMFMISIFAILLSLLEYKDKKEINNNFVNIILLVLTLLSILLTLIVLIKSAMAMYINIPKYDKDTINLENQINIVTLNERRVMLDPYEYNYRKELDKQYDIYLEMLDNKIKDERSSNIDILNNEMLNIVQVMVENANVILNNNKYDEEQVLYACSIYFRNIDNLSKIYYKQNKSLVYQNYIKFINDKINYLEKLYINNDKILNKLIDIKKEYNSYKLNY